MSATVVLDIGKTNAKLTLLDEAGATLATRRRTNAVLQQAPYPQHDVEGIWHWLLDTLHTFAQTAEIGAIVPVTHGATAALIDEHGLVLPVLDYESTLPESLNDDYQALRPPFGQTLSPDLPAGLNLGRQLFWLARTFPEQFARVRHILSYPQYWAWRLSNVAAGEVTSLGCHTDLWLPRSSQYSSLVMQMAWRALLPPLQPAWATLGPLLPELATRTGLPANCQVLCGIHDSNASLLRHLNTGQRSILSSGTWVIAAALGAPLEHLSAGADMLANVDATGQPVACMRFMGGREFAALAGPDPVACTLGGIERLIAQGSMALPCFAESGGPFVGRHGFIDGPQPQTPEERYALATLYCVLMSDYCLDQLQADGPVTVEGSLGDNPFFAGLLSALRGVPVTLTDDTSGTTCGGWMLHRWGQTPILHATVAPLLAPHGWHDYRKRWRNRLQEHRTKTAI